MKRRIAATALVLLAIDHAAGYETFAVVPGDYPALETGLGSVDLLATGEDTDGLFGIIITNDQFGGPGHRVRLHGASQALFVLEGTYEFHVDDLVFDATPGTLVSVDADQTYGYSSKGEGRLLVVFSPAGFEQFFVDWAEKGFGPGPELELLERRYGLTRHDP
jgi:mannose-6-phosphate isomerase-like protein (cupin superfamily)